MNRHVVAIISVGFCFLPQTAQAQQIYSEDYENQADFSVYVVDYKNQADLLVYKVDCKNQAKDNSGKWFFNKYKNTADKTIYFVDYKNQSDLKIYFVEYKNQAGWRQESKKYLLY